MAPKYALNLMPDGRKSDAFFQETREPAKVIFDPMPILIAHKKKVREQRREQKKRAKARAAVASAKRSPKPKQQSKTSKKPKSTKVFKKPASSSSSLA